MYSGRKIVAIDLFCGAGGLTRGLLDAGIDVRFGVDFDDSLRHTYESNNRPAIYYRSDIRSLSGMDLQRQLNIRPEELFLLAACAPCQPFSKCNKYHKYDRRKSLLLEVARILDEFEIKPDLLFVENVPAIAKIDNGKVIKKFCIVLDKLNYIYKSNIIDAKDYGVPQTRKRFIMLGVKKGIYNYPLPFPLKTYGKGLIPYKTVRDAIGHLPKLKAGQLDKNVPNHESANMSMINLRRLSFVPRDGGSRLSWPDELKLKCHIDHNGHTDVYGRMKWDLPSPALTCRCTSISNGRFGHPSQLRAISLREAAQLQTFPSSYIFYGMFESMSKQVGNAVPVLLAKKFAEHLLTMLNKIVPADAARQAGTISAEPSPRSKNDPFRPPGKEADRDHISRSKKKLQRGALLEETQSLRSRLTSPAPEEQGKLAPGHESSLHGA